MKTEDRYLKFVLWNEDDRCYVGHCPDLFPWGGVCHGETEEKVFHQLRLLVQQEIAELTSAGKEMPMSATRAMREAVLA
jgi:hypothetical protein